MSRRVLAITLYLMLTAVSAALVGWLGFRDAIERLAERADADLRLAAERLTGQLEAYREQAVLIADHPAVMAALTGGGNAAANALLLSAADRIGAADMQIIDARGQVRARSSESIGNGDESQSRHFARAQQGATGFDHMVSDTGERLVLFAAPVFSPDGPVLGAVTLRVRVSKVEANWRGETPTVFFTDRQGVIFVSNRSELLFVQRYAGREPSAGTTLPADVLSFQPHGFSGHELWAIDAGAYIPDFALHLQQDLPVIEMTAEILHDARPALRLAGLQAAVTAAALLGFGSVLLGLSDRRRALADKLTIEARANAELESRVAVRTRELSTAVERLREEIRERQEAETALRKAQADLVQASKLSALGQMSAGISHELNQPLMAIRSFAENGRAFLDRGDGGKAAENLDRISELGRRMGRIIKNLRAFARQEVEAISDVDLVGVVNAVLEMSEARIAREGVRLNWEAPGRAVMVRGGEVRLQQVVMNLVSNALDAMDDREARELTITLERAEGQVLLRVADTGPGISEPDKIFDPFYSTKAVGAAEGMGLGLSISYGIVKSFGGRIAGNNRPGGGAEFVVSLQPILSERAA